MSSKKRKHKEEIEDDNEYKKSKVGTNASLKSKKLVGSSSKGMMDVPIQICNRIRKTLFNENIGHQFPFQFDAGNNRLKLLAEQDFKKEDVTQELIFRKGYCKKDEIERYETFVKEQQDKDKQNNKKKTNTSKVLISKKSQGNIRFLPEKSEERFISNVPYIYEKVGGKTSQGKVYLGVVQVENANISLIVKIDPLNKKNLWFTNSTVHCKGMYSTYKVLSESFMDAICMILFSNLVEQRISPAFPLCYSTNVSYIHYKLDNKPMGKNKLPSQIIWMEYLPHSMYKILKDEPNAMCWWSAFFQVFAALCILRNRYGVVHNDLHSSNVRVRKVGLDTYLYYKASDGTLLKVPTFGYVLVLIDFGRCVLYPHGPKNANGQENQGFISAEFDRDGNCHSMVPDNATIDMIRLINSIEDTTDVIKPKKDEKELRKMFEFLCETDDKSVNLFKTWNDKTLAKKINYYLDIWPRKICTKRTVFEAIPLFYKKFQVKTIPTDIQPFSIPLSL